MWVPSINLGISENHFLVLTTNISDIASLSLTSLSINLRASYVYTVKPNSQLNKLRVPQGYQGYQIPELYKVPGGGTRGSTKGTKSHTARHSTPKLLKVEGALNS